MQMAMVAAAVANGGMLMEPQVLDRVLAPSGKTVASFEPKRMGRAISAQTAQALTEGMKAAVSGGTSTAAQLPGIEVAGKTGTAETGRERVNTVSFIAFAPAADAQIAIAVFVEGQRSTGGATAAPIAKEVMQSLLSNS
jgi:peptidoglycan glycosyltransferase